MELTIDQALQQGIAAHKEGKLQDAERLYRAILKSQPNHPDANHNLGVLAVAVGKPLEAIPLFKLSLEANPKIEQFWLSYADVLMTLEHFDEAKRVLVEAEQSGVSSDKLNALKQQLLLCVPNDTNKAAEGPTVVEKRKKLAEKKKRKKRKARADSSGAAPSQDEINLLLGYHQAGRLEEAEALATVLTQQFPKHPFGWKVLGVVFQQTGRLSESLAPKQKATELSPQDAEAHSNLGNTLQELRRLEEAEASHARAIALKPNYTEAHYNLGITLKELGRLNEAEASYRKTIELKPDYAKVHNNLGVTLKEMGRFDEAEASLRQAIALKPDFGEAHNNLGITLHELGRLDEAEENYRQAIALNSDFAEAQSNLGYTLQALGRLDEAEAVYRQAIALKPDFTEAHHNLSSVKKFSSQDEQFFQMQALYRDPAISEENRCHLCFALAKASEDLGDCATAFQFYAEGNALRKEYLDYDKTQDEQLFKKLKGTHSRITSQIRELEFVAPEYAPIFIVGMPRSGTTLVEQIISSHRLVTGAGELSFIAQYGGPLAVGETTVDEKVLTTFREQYLHALQQRSEGNVIVTDKMPQNFHFLGLITAAFPEAKIIHVKRDPAAVCWANYTQYFTGDSLWYCHSLDDILHYYKLYQDLMKFWHQTLPDRIYDLDYELLTENQEKETRKLISHVGLDWDNACLSPQKNTRSVATASNMQVRQRVYQGSSEKWKRYQPYLNGALDHFNADNK